MFMSSWLARAARRTNCMRLHGSTACRSLQEPCFPTWHARPDSSIINTTWFPDVPTHQSSIQPGFQTSLLNHREHVMGIALVWRRGGGHLAAFRRFLRFFLERFYSRFFPRRVLYLFFPFSSHFLVFLILFWNSQTFFWNHELLLNLWIYIKFINIFLKFWNFLDSSTFFSNPCTFLNSWTFNKPVDLFFQIDHI